MKRQLNDMVVIITGSSAGIGQALAREFSEQGAQLVLSARRAERLEELNASLGGRHLVVPGDISQPDACTNLIQRAIERFGRIDTLVCNAGYGIAKKVADTTPDDMRRIFATNVFGTTDCINAALPIMRRQQLRDGYRGQVMIVSSAIARRGMPNFGAYSATKCAQLGLAEAMRVELRSSRIAVTSVHPIGTSTEFFSTAEKYGTARVTPPQRTMQTAEHVAKRMMHAIQRPRPEVWPLRISRIGLSLSTMVPGLVDWVLANFSGRDCKPADPVISAEAPHPKPQ